MSNSYISEEEQRRQLLLEKKAQIDAELATFPLTNTSPTSRTQYGRHQPPQHVVARSYSHSGQPMSRKASSGRGQSEAIPMSASVPQHSAPMMGNTGMQALPSSGSSMRFTKAGLVPHTLQIVDNQREPLMIDSWSTGHDDPMTVYHLHPSQHARTLSQRKSELEQVTEIDSGDHPVDYFTRTDSMPIFSTPQSPIDQFNGNQWQSPSHRGSISSRRRPSFGVAIPSTPSSGELTTASTFASEMSRQNSLSNEALLGPFAMMNVNSNTSIFTDSNSTDGMSYQSTIAFPKLFSSEDRSQLLVGTGGASEDSQLQHPLPDLRVAAPHFPSISSFAGDMKRSESSESNSSSSSGTSRATTRLKLQNQLASRRLAPKAGSEEAVMHREGSHAMVSMKSKDGSESRAVQQITKAPYQRPKHARVFCKLCSDNPEGFRGQHELRRHQDRQHKMSVKKFVCVEPADGIHPLYQPVNPLSKCKACMNQKKKYGAYYNAAAHLRRAHFKPKRTGARKSAKVDDKSEKRGGNGGGEWPPMDECKRWMKEVFESATEGSSLNEEEEEEEEFEDDNCSGSYENDESYTALHDISNISSVNSDFGNAYAYDDTPMLDAYPAPLPSFNSPIMQNTAYDNLVLTPGIDLSMPIDSSHSSFADSQFASMNDISFIDSFPQPFADQVLGQNSFSNFQY